MSAPTLISEHPCFGGVQRFYKHDSSEVRGPMKFSAFIPPQARTGKVPVLYYLSGLTCTEETFPIKAHAQQAAAERGLLLIAPDTSPREPRLPGDADSWDFGYSAGFYVDATVAPWSQYYRMYSYVTRELPETVTASLAGAGGCHGNLRPFHGRARRAGLCAAQSRTLQISLGVRADCGAHAVSLGQEGVYQLSGRRRQQLARIRCQRTGGAPAVSRTHPHRSGYRQTSFWPSSCCRRNSRRPRRSQANA